MTPSVADQTQERQDLGGRCPVCGADGARLLFVARDLHSLVPGDHTLLACGSCTHVFVDPRPGRDEMNRYYSGDYWLDMETAHEMTSGVRQLIGMAAGAHPGGRALDVCCAAGKKTAALQAAGLQVTGLDPYEQACVAAREMYGIEAICAHLQEAVLPVESYDAITFFDVLEHVHDPVGDLRKVRALLKPGGAVYLKAPNNRSWQARVFGKWWAVLDPPRHLHHFTPRSLRRCLEAAGFADVWSSSPPDPLGGFKFELSLLLWVRGTLWARRGVVVTSVDGTPPDEMLRETTCPGVPRHLKQAFRRLARHVLYLPFALENIVGSSATLLAGGRK